MAPNVAPILAWASRRAPGDGKPGDEAQEDRGFLGKTQGNNHALWIQVPSQEVFGV